MRSIADRALVRLAFAYEQTGNWGSCRQALEHMAGHYPRSPWINEARFGIGFAREKANDFTNATAGYASVIANTSTAVAAKAQLRIGYCYLAQKKYVEAAKAFLVVPYTYGYADHSATAWYQAGLAHIAAKNLSEAEKTLEQLLRNHPKSKHVEDAKKQLTEIKKQLAELKKKPKT